MKEEYKKAHLTADSCSERVRSPTVSTGPSTVEVLPDTLKFQFLCLKGQLDAYCNGVRTGSGGTIYEEWVVFCDDNKNGELDEDEQKVQFETVYDYVFTGTDPKNYKGIDKIPKNFDFREVTHWRTLIYT